MNKPRRQAELNKIIRTTLENNSELSDALEVFQMSQAEYMRAVAAMTHVQIFASSSTNPRREKNAGMERGKGRNRKAK